MRTPSSRHFARVVGLAFCLTALARPVHAQTDSLFISPDVAPVSASLEAPAPPLKIEAPGDLTRPKRSPTFMAMQISFGALQVLEVVSTVRALNQGHQEGNALMRGVAGNPVALASVKGGAAVTTMLLARRVAKKNPLVAVAVMAAVNSAYSMIVVHNLRIAAR
jgi:hypothetical protein